MDLSLYLKSIRDRTQMRKDLESGLEARRYDVVSERVSRYKDVGLLTQDVRGLKKQVSRLEPALETAEDALCRQQTGAVKEQSRSRSEAEQLSKDVRGLKKQVSRLEPALEDVEDALCRQQTGAIKEQSRSRLEAERLSEDVRGLKKEVARLTAHLSENRSELEARVRCEQGRVNEREIAHSTNVIDITCLASAASGDMVLAGGDVKASAAALNAAAATTHLTRIAVRLDDSGGANHTWASFAPVLSASKGDVADADVSDPTIDGSPVFQRGALLYDVVADTDAGATKTYISGEQMTTTIKVAADDTYLTHSVAELVINIDIVD